MSEQVTIQKISSQLITYPSDGKRKTGAKAGRYLLDFEQGLVIAPDGTTEKMSNDLARIGKNFVRSCFIAVSTVDALIKLGQNILPKGQQLTYVINGIGFQNMEIEFPTDRTPKNDFSFLVIGSDSEVFPVSIDVLLATHQPTTQTGNTTDNYVTVFDILFTSYSQITLLIENTGGVNTMTAQVQVSEDGVNWVAAQGYPVDVAINDANVFQSSIKHKYYRVQVKSKVAGSATSYRVQANLER